MYAGLSRNGIPLQPSGAHNVFAGTPTTNQPASGGAGCEPGYTYLFPAEHTKIHVLKTAMPPWQLPANTAVESKAYRVPVSMKLQEILKAFGANGRTASKNKCYEITQGMGGGWYKGLCFSGDDKEWMKKQIKDVGWDASRTGKPGEKPVVYLWLTKDG